MMAPEWPLSPLDQILTEREIAAGSSDAAERWSSFRRKNKCTEWRRRLSANENKDVTHAFFALEKIGTYSNEVHSLSLVCPVCPLFPGESEVRGKGWVILILFLSLWRDRLQFSFGET